MKKRWIYCGLQILFVLSIAGPIFGTITQNEQFLASFTGLGYPVYLSYLLMVAYLVGVIAIFQSRFELLKEWAYAGFTFALSGAFLSHVLSGEASRGGMALIGLSFLLSAYFLEKRSNPQKGKRSPYLLNPIF